MLLSIGALRDGKSNLRRRWKALTGKIWVYFMVAYPLLTKEAKMPKKNKPVKIYTKTYPSALGYKWVSISINVDDFLEGYKAGLASDPALPDIFILDFAGWHIGYANGSDARVKMTNYLEEVWRSEFSKVISEEPSSDDIRKINNFSEA